MKILVLGATGFIGRNMVEWFAANPEHEVIAGYRGRRDACPEIRNVTWRCCDLTDTTDSPYLRDVDVLIQAAATTSGSKDITSFPEIHVTDNAVMNSLIFRAAHEAKVKHVIFFSCTTMFREGVITEESPIDIHPKYFGVAHTKLYIEKLAEFYAGIGDTKFTVIRHSNIYGPHDKFDLERSHVFGATVTKVMTAADKITVWGSGEESRDLLYIDDLVDFVEAAIENQPTKFGLYNCGLGRAVKIKNLVAAIVMASGKDLEIEHDLSAPTIPVSLSLDCTKAKNELGWEPKVPLEEGIMETLEWWRKNVA